MIEFAPSASVDRHAVPSAVAVKGSTPELDYRRSYAEVHEAAPSGDVLGAYRMLSLRLEAIASRLVAARGDCVAVARPEVRTAADAGRALESLLAPDCVGRRFDARQDDRCLRRCWSVLLPGPARPFPLATAGAANLAYSLGWIDTNLKLAAEQVGHAAGMDEDAVRDTAADLLAAYAILLKADGFVLASRISANHSMALQDRLLNAAFGTFSAVLERHRLELGRRANRAMLGALRAFGPDSLQSHGELAVLAGVVFVGDGGDALAALEQLVRADPGRSAFGDVERLLDVLGDPPAPRLGVVLDDNGEAVFDIALLQVLMARVPALHVDLLLSDHAVSSNISLRTFRDLVATPDFAAIRAASRSGRLTIIREAQQFPSFEMERMSRPGTRALDTANAVYLKGLGPFETLQATRWNRFYAFTVSGPTSALLTGHARGSGILAHIPPGRLAYEAVSGEHVVPLATLSRSEC